jgi:hypothetical protein
MDVHDRRDVSVLFIGSGPQTSGRDEEAESVTAKLGLELFNVKFTGSINAGYP